MCYYVYDYLLVNFMPLYHQLRTRFRPIVLQGSGVNCDSFYELRTRLALNHTQTPAFNY